MFQAYGPHLRLPFLPRGRCAALAKHPPFCSFLAARALTGPDGSSGAPGASTLQACAGLCHIRSIAGVPPGHPALGKHTWEPIQVQQGPYHMMKQWDSPSTVLLARGNVGLLGVQTISLVHSPSYLPGTKEVRILSDVLSPTNPAMSKTHMAEHVR